MFGWFGDDERVSAPAAEETPEDGNDETPGEGNDGVGGGGGSGGGGDGDIPPPNCADSWDGNLYPGYILTLQEGGPSAGDDGGDIHAFDPTGCYLGKVFTELTPWYAYGLKASATQYGTNFVETASVLDGTLAMPILQWAGSSNSTTGFTLGSFITPTDGNGSNTAYANLDQTYFQVAFTHLFDSQHRFVSYTSQHKIKAFLNGTEQASCEVATTGKTVGALSASISNIALATKAFYAWTTDTTGAEYGVGSLTPCNSGSVTDTPLFSASASNARASGVMEVRNAGSAWHQDILVTVGGYFGGTFRTERWDYNGASWVNQGEPFTDRTHAVTQDAYRTGSFSAAYGDLYTIESDSNSVYLRRYRTDAGFEGTLRATLYTEPKGQGPAFKENFSPTGTWITVIPPPY